MSTRTVETFGLEPPAAERAAGSPGNGTLEGGHPTSEAGEAAADQKANILLVDDREDKRMALETVIEGLGHIVKASSGKEALRCLLHQDFAVILLDVNMPGLDGFETAHLIRQRQRSAQTPIIFITAISDNETH